MPEFAVMDPRPPAPPAAPVPTGDWGTAPPRPREPQPGEQIGPYRLVRQIGRGGMAVVFEADDTELPRRVALKILVDTDPQAKLRFVREAHAQAKVSHDNVVPIYRVGEDRGVSYIAMPVLSGQSLAQALVATPKPPLPAVVRIASEMAEGLAAAHAAGLIHRDIKPANVWLEAPKWRVKILDFGLVRDPHANTQINITMQGHVVGTPAYMSPEQAAGQDVDHRTDLWSLGVVLYQMTTGKRPFNDDNTVNLMTAIVSQEAAAPVDLAPDLPAKLSDLIRRLMAKKPSKRPATAAAVAAELDAIGKSLVAPPVVVVSLPAVVPEGPPSGANPWNDLEATRADLSRAATPAVAKPAAGDDSADRPAPRRRPRPKAAGVPKWVWIAGGAFAAVLAIGALVAVALSGKTPPTDPTAQEQLRPIPAPTPKPPAVKKEEPKREPDYERDAAEAFRRFAKLKLVVDGDKVVEVPPNVELPAGKFVVAGIDFGNTADHQLNAAFVRTVFLPALTHLKGLGEVRATRWQLELSPDQIRQMAAWPLVHTLRALEVAVELTPASIDELKKFRHLSALVLVPAEPSDELFARLTELAPLRQLALYRVGRNDRLTSKGWGVVAGLPLDVFALGWSRGAPDALQAFGARRGKLDQLVLMECKDCSDEALRSLGPTSDIHKLEFRFIGLTDVGLQTLAAMRQLRTVVLVDTNTTDRGARWLAETRPGLQVWWHGRYFGPRK